MVSHETAEASDNKATRADRLAQQFDTMCAGPRAEHVLIILVTPEQAKQSYLALLAGGLEARKMSVEIPGVEVGLCRAHANMGEDEAWKAARNNPTASVHVTTLRTALCRARPRVDVIFAEEAKSGKPRKLLAEYIAYYPDARVVVRQGVILGQDTAWDIAWDGLCESEPANDASQ